MLLTKNKLPKLLLVIKGFLLLRITSVITEVPKTKGQGIWENPELKDFPVITCYTPRVEPSLIKIKKRRSESAAGLTTASLLFLSMKAGGGVIKSLLRYLNNFGNLLF